MFRTMREKRLALPLLFPNILQYSVYKVANSWCSCAVKFDIPVTETSIFFPSEDTTPGKPKFGDIDRFRNAILVRWLPPDNAGLVCVTGYLLWWGENTPFHFSAGPLSKDHNHYLIKNLSEYKIISLFKHMEFNKSCNQIASRGRQNFLM